MDYLIKLDRRSDAYVVWSLDRDWPESWGPRHELAASGTAADFERAEEFGIAPIGNSRIPVWGGWDDHQGLQVGDYGVVQRGDLAAMLERLSKDPDADLVDLLASVDDSGE